MVELIEGAGEALRDQRFVWAGRDYIFVEARRDIREWRDRARQDIRGTRDEIFVEISRFPQPPPGAAAGRRHAGEVRRHGRFAIFKRDQITSSCRLLTEQRWRNLLERLIKCA